MVLRHEVSQVLRLNILTIGGLSSGILLDHA